jgi:hypothetical protein
MVVWGGYGDEGFGPGYLNTGGLHAGAWFPTSTTGAPAGRLGHTAVWTGSLMVVWGGEAGGGVSGTGGRYVLGHGVDNDGDGLSECAGDCNDADPAIHPGAAEVCDGLDNNCDGIVDNAPVPAGTPSMTVAPSGGDTDLSWTPLAGATGYDVVRGDLGTLRSGGGDFAAATQACLANNTGATSLTVMDTAPVGGGLFYLVRGVNCGGAGTYDEGTASQVGSRDAGIAASSLACP